MTMNRRTALKTFGVLALGLQVGAEVSRAAEAESIGASEMIEARRTAMGNVNEIVVRYLSVWNEQDATRRRDLVAKHGRRMGAMSTERGRARATAASTP
jgi:hypothetical protein